MNFLGLSGRKMTPLNREVSIEAKQVEVLPGLAQADSAGSLKDI